MCVNIQAFWGVRPCRLLSSYQHLKGGSPSSSGSRSLFLGLFNSGHGPTLQGLNFCIESPFPQEASEQFFFSKKNTFLSN